MLGLMVWEEVSILREGEAISRVDIISRSTTMEIISFITIGTVSSIIIITLMIASSSGLVSHIMGIRTTTIRTITDITTTTERPTVTSIGAI